MRFSVYFDCILNERMVLLFFQSKSYFFVHGAKSSSDSLQLLSNEFDIILIQEHWLYPDELRLICPARPIVMTLLVCLQ